PCKDRWRCAYRIDRCSASRYRCRLRAPHGDWRTREQSYETQLHRELGYSLSRAGHAEVGYVGTFARHLSSIIDTAPIPIGTRFVPQTADPSNPKVPLPDTSYSIPADIM